MAGSDSHRCQSPVALVDVEVAAAGCAYFSYCWCVLRLSDYLVLQVGHYVSCSLRRMPPEVALASDDSDDDGDGDDDDGAADNLKTTTEALIAAGKGVIALLLTVVADVEIGSPWQLPMRTNKHRSCWRSLDTWRRSRAIVRVVLRLDHLW